MLVVSLIKENVLSISTIGSIVLQNTVRTDTVLFDNGLPKLTTDLVATLAYLQGNNFSRHFSKIE